MGAQIDNFLKATFGWLPARIALGILSFFGFLNLYMVRVNLAIIIVAMISRNDSSSSSSTPAVSACYPALNISTGDDGGGPGNASSSLGEPEATDGLDWSETVQGLVLGSFFYGYATTQVVGGRAAEVWGTKKVFGLCILAGGISSLLSPVAAKLHYGVLIALRIAQGFCQGVSWPAMHALTSRWVPPLERPRFVAYVYFSTALSAFLTLPLCGLIIDAHGWEAAFYVSGALSIVWCLAWFTLVFDSPAEHTRISQKELHYIQTSISGTGTSTSPVGRGRIGDAPWREIFTSLPVLALVAHAIGNSWGIALLYSQTPTYMKNILGFSIKENGIVSALPFLSRYLGCIMWGSLSDLCASRRYLSVLATRRLASLISMWGPGVMMLGLAYNGCNWQSAVALMCVALFCNGAITSSYMVGHTDIAPNYAGTLLGIDNTLGSIIGFVVPVVVGLITEGEQTVGQWQKVFWLCVPFYGLAEIVYLLCMSTSVQPWNSRRDEKGGGDDVTAAAAAAPMLARGKTDKN